MIPFILKIPPYQFKVSKILNNYLEIDILGDDGKGFTHLAPMNPRTKIINWANVYNFPFPEELKVTVGKLVKLNAFI